MKKIIFAFLLLLSPTLYAFTFTNYTPYAIDVAYSRNTFWSISKHVSILPNQRGFICNDTSESENAYLFTITVIDAARAIKHDWILRTYSGIAHFGLKDSAQLETLVLNVNGRDY